MNTSILKNLIAEKKEIDQKMTGLSKSIFDYLDQYSTSSFMFQFIGSPRYEFYKDKSLKGLHVASLNASCIESLGKIPKALKIADESYFRELFSNYILEYKEDILPEGVYICYASEDCAEINDLRVYMDLPLELAGSHQLKLYDFKKLLLIQLPP